MSDGTYSFQTGEKNTFSTVDYAIFGITLLISAFIGIFYAIKDRHKQDTKDFLLAGGNMHYFPVSVSLTCSFISAITLLGTPAEMYRYNTMYMWKLVVFVPVMFLVAHVYVPIYYNLNLTSAYDYLGRRFNSRAVRIMGTLVFLLHMTTYMPIVLYGPSLALNAVTGFSLWGSVVSVGVVCTLYTSLGGMKAVLWTDTFQGLLMVVGILVALIEGCIQVGGISRAFEIADKFNRVEYLEVNPDPRTRHSVWSLLIGGVFVWSSLYGANQAQIQRTLTLPTLRDSQKAIWLNLPGLWLIVTLTSLIGVVMFAFYHECDPIKFGLVEAHDQIFPLFVMDMLAHLPGIPGLFIASIFSGALSTVSSGLNALSAVILEDLVRPLCCKKLSVKSATNVARLIGIIFGGVCLGMTYVASKLGGILQAALSIHSIVAGPMLGVFSLGMFFPWANKWGALSGVITSLLVTGWINIGALTSNLPSLDLPVQVHGCNWTVTGPTMINGSTIAMTTQTMLANMSTTTESLLIYPPQRELVGIENLYRMSYLWYAPMSFIIVISVGMLVSFITGFNKVSDIDPKFLCPLFDIICPCFPERWHEKLRLGVQHEGKYDDQDTTTEQDADPQGKSYDNNAMAAEEGISSIDMDTKI